jgi:hypothetical protein
LFSVIHDGELHAWARDEPVGAEEQVWLENAVELGFHYAREVSDEIELHGIDIAFVGRAAEALWAASPGSPHWRDLDADGVLPHIERMCGAHWRANAVASLIGFSHFLARRGKLTEGEALVIRSRFNRFVPPEMIAAGYKPVELPPSLRPS